MGMWTAQSDLDYYDELNGSPGRGTIERTCAHCGHKFRMSLKEEYVIRPVCDECFVEAHFKSAAIVKGTR